MNPQVPRKRRPIDPALKQYLDEIAAPAPVEQAVPETPANRRAVMNRALENRTNIPGLPNRVETRDLTITARRTARLYTPPDAVTPLPVLLYMHGGGWVVGSIATHDPFCRLLCEAAGIQILSIDYRLAPEYPFPAALNDTLAAWHWLVEHTNEVGGDRLAARSWRRQRRRQPGNSSSQPPERRRRYRAARSSIAALPCYRSPQRRPRFLH